MASWSERACTALTVYYERGVHALGLFRTDQWEEAETMLNMRKAAFHNFRAADHLALQDGYSEEQEARLKDVWRQIVEIDAQLLEAIEDARDRMELEVIRIGRLKTTLGKFKSGGTADSRIEKPV